MKIIQITSDHGYLVGLDESGKIYKFEMNIKEKHPTDKKLIKYINKWVLLSEATGEWCEDVDLPF